jgi:hypothetical protein
VRNKSPYFAVAVVVVVGGATMLTTGGLGTGGLPGLGFLRGAQRLPFEIQSLDGSGNNKAHRDWGRAGTKYSREVPPRYADGISKPATGPNARMVSNRVFNDVNQNVFSETQVSQWGFVWGQFLDHTFGLRSGKLPGDPGAEEADIRFDNKDPLEDFTNDLGVIPFVRSDAAKGTGVSTPREQINTVSSYIDGWAVYGGTDERLEWLRQGPVDGDLSNNSALLLLPNGLLPRRDSRGKPVRAPQMDVDGRLRGQPTRAAVAGDLRANENVALTATHTLFAREHNRVVRSLPNSLSEEAKFQIARRVIIAEQQYITYNEFLPAMGIDAGQYDGYDPTLNANLTNEFATVGYRAHSMIHGEVELASEEARYSSRQIAAFKKEGLEVTTEDGKVEIAIPLNVAFFNPDLVGEVQLGPLLQGIGSESQYRNDEQIDNQLRSVLFQVPVKGNPECLDGPGLPHCFKGVIDLGAVDIERGRDHGIPGYNRLRQAYGLFPKRSFTEITGEDSGGFPSSGRLTRGDEIDDPDSLDVMTLDDIDGKPIDLDDEEALDTSGITEVRRTPVAARLRAIYGSVDKLDAFTGMLVEEHVPGSNFGELQRAMWTIEFQRLRGGDRFFYANDPGLGFIRREYGIDYRTNLGDVIARNTDIRRSELAPDVFLVKE